MRLTLLYGGLFLLSGAALMAITYALLVNAGFVFTLQNGRARTRHSTVRLPQLARQFCLRLALGLAATTHPPAQTMAYWRRSRSACASTASPVPDPTTSVPSSLPHDRRQVSDRDGAILVIPATINMQSPAFTQAATRAGSRRQQSQRSDNRGARRYGNSC